MIGRALLFWFGLAGIGVINGTLRQMVYGPFLSPGTAHVVSSLTALILIYAAAYGYVRWEGRRLDPRRAVAVGALWVALTVLFEFGFGHWVMGHPWSRLLADYDLSAGRVWILVLVGIGAAPRLWVRRQEGSRASPPLTERLG